MSENNLQQLGQKLTGSDYNALLSSLNQTALVSMTDEKGVIIYANQKFVEISKYQLSELIGQNHRILKSGHQPQELFEKLWRTISGGEVWRGEIKNKAKDGTYYWVDTSIAPIPGKSSKPERYISVRFLITDKKEIEADNTEKLKELENTKTSLLSVLEDLDAKQKLLEQSRAKDEAILASIGDGLVATDNAGKIVLVNRAFVSMIGLEETEVLGKMLVDVVQVVNTDGSAVPASERLITKILNRHDSTTTTTTTTTTVSYKRKDGTIFPVAAAISSIVAGEEFIGVVEVFRDITKEKEVDKAKTEFVSLASHQLRTPTTSIRWYAEMLLGEKEVGTLNATQKKYLQEIYRSDRRMIDLVNSLLNVSRIELGTFVPQPRQADIRKLLEDILQDLSIQISEKRVTVQYKQKQPALSIQTDPQLLRVALSNLITNAIEYTQTDGVISCGAAPTDHTVQITVSDTGCGIPYDEQSKIFTKFFRADNARIIKPDGNGLGLYITKSIVEALGGSVTFTSKETVGTTFTVTLPMRSPQEKAR